MLDELSELPPNKGQIPPRSQAGGLAFLLITIATRTGILIRFHALKKKATMPSVCRGMKLYRWHMGWKFVGRVKKGIVQTLKAKDGHGNVVNGS